MLALGISVGEARYEAATAGSSQIPRWRQVLDSVAQALSVEMLLPVRRHTAGRTGDRLAEWVVLRCG
jgi:hypothetical protein